MNPSLNAGEFIAKFSNRGRFHVIQNMSHNDFVNEPNRELHVALMTSSALEFDGNFNKKGDPNNVNPQQSLSIIDS